ncbi:MAG: GMC family oxidoreductase [Gammaproteobacteria bacterium]|nr:GMC family oxidoreductase [Gammaproteobacteria bacterium]NNM01313.1 GMC family oxidoreductase [Gammaproteobacteria bacterium]
MTATGGACLLGGARIVQAAQLGDTLPDADVLIIGSGASGAAAAWRLASTGLNVVCLEQGDHVDYAESPAAKSDWELIRQRQWSPSPNARGRDADYPVADGDTPIKPLMYNAVGGSTIMWSCHSPRFHPSDFKIRSLDGVGADWPIDYFELEPYYELNQKMVGISGVNGDPAYPDRSPHPLPPIPIGTGGERVAAAMDKLGWHWWPADIQVNSEAYGAGRGQCNHCGPCELGCPLRAKGSTDVTYWPLALEAGADLITGARVFEIETDAKGRATGAVFYDRAGKTRRQRAGIVIVAANGIGTPRLLLLSRSKAHPNGLANSSDMVGRNLMFHPVAAVTGVFDEPLDSYRGITACAIASHQFYETDPSRDFVRGYMLQLVRGVGPVLTALNAYGVPQQWGPGHHRRFLEVFNHTSTMAVVGEDLPDPDNRVTLDESLTDSNGIAAPKITYRLQQNARRMLDHGLARSREIFTAAGAREMFEVDLLVDGGFHLMGTARMGDNPETSVTDRWGRSHDVDNLFIIDGSLFASAAAVNPTITIQSLALRAADHILETRQDARTA